jgi:superfamily II RNA helicase
MEHNFEVLTGPCDTIISDPAFVFPYECDDFQKHSFVAIEKGNHIIVSAPTSSGKTACALYMIACHLKKGHYGVYTSPTKSLSREKYFEFKELFGKVGLLTGDDKIDVDSPLIVATAEILRNTRYKLKNKIESDLHEIKDDFIDKVKFEIHDEAHYINDTSRGSVWEEMFVLAPNDVQQVLISATMPNIFDFAKWYSSIKTNKVSVVMTSKRMVPLRHYLYLGGEKMYNILDDKDTYNELTYHEAKRLYETEQKERDKKHKSSIDFNLIQKTVKYMKDHNLLQAIFFSFSKANCERYAEGISIQLNSHQERYDALKVFDNKIIDTEKIYGKPHYCKIMPQVIKMRDCIQNGIAFHHSGLMSFMKDIVEKLFEMGLVKVLFATETFAVGVNKPTRTVVFTELEKRTGGVKRFLNTAEYKQMSGRAGRRGLDDEGFVLIIPYYGFPENNDLKNVMLSTMPRISSKFKLDYQFVLKTCHSEIVTADSFFSKTFKDSEHIETKKILVDKISDTEKKIGEYTEFIDGTLLNVTKFKKLYDLENISKTNLGFGITMTLDKKQQKELTNLKGDIKKLNISDKYKKYIEYKKLVDMYNEYNNELSYYSIYLDKSINPIRNILIESGFMEDEKTPTIKGIIASHINECNGLILAEILTSKMINDMTPQEIIALISLFCNTGKDSDDEFMSIRKAILIPDKVETIKYLVDKFRKLEKKYGVHIDEEFWALSTQYIELSYMWASGASLAEILYVLQEYNEYEGNFVKNMLKIYNISHDMIGVCKMLHDFDNVKKLEEVDKLLLRDIVSVNNIFV